MKILGKKSKGFTLIELLVVIAIIGILAAIVLINVRSARNKAKDAAIKGNLSALPAAAEIYYDDNVSVYTGFCASEDGARVIAAVTAQVKTGGAVNCTDADTAWAACAELWNPGTGMTSWCVDGKGNAEETSSCDNVNTDCDFL